jgi:hypothetical protein
VHQTKRRYIVTLAAVAAGILVLGSLLRPRDATTDLPIRSPSQAELSRLARLAQRRSLDSMTEYFAAVVADVESSVVELPSLRRSGLLWESGLVLTARTERKFPYATTVSTPSGDVGVATVSAGPHLPISALRMSSIAGIRLPRKGSTERLDRGEWTVAIWRQDRQANFTPTHFLGRAPVGCGEHIVDELLSSVTWTQDMAGGGLFDLDGNLIAVIVQCDRGFSAVSTDDIASLLSIGRSLEGQLLNRFGLRPGMLTEAEAKHVGLSHGVVIREIWRGYPADGVDLAPGDVLFALGANPIDNSDELEPLTATDIPFFDVTVYRSGTLFDIQLPTEIPLVTPSDTLSPAEGLEWKAPSGGLTVDAVAPDSQANAAGISAGDLLLRINGVAVQDTNQVRDVLSPDRTTSVFVELERTGRRWIVLLRQPKSPESNP